MDSTKSMKEYVAREKSLTFNVKYYDIEFTEQEISRRVFNDPPRAYASGKHYFALKTDFSLSDPEGGLRVKELNRSSDRTDGSHALVAAFKAISGD